MHRFGKKKKEKNIFFLATMIQGKSQIILFKIFLRVASEKSFLVFPEFNFSRNVSKATIFSQIRNFFPALAFKVESLPRFKQIKFNLT